MMINPAPLAPTALQLRSGSRDLAPYIDDMCDRVDFIDPAVQALLPEPGRRERLRILHQQLIFAEFAQENAAIYAEHAERYRPRTVEIIEKGKSMSREQWSEGLASTSQVRKDLEALMDRAGIDLWICPAAPGPAPQGIQATGDPIMNLPWTHAGMPAITLPGMLSSGDGLPLGLQVVARFGADEALLAWSEELHRYRLLGVGTVSASPCALQTRAVEPDVARLDLPLQFPLASAKGRAAQERQPEGLVCPPYAFTNVP